MERCSRCCGKHHKTHDYEKGNHSQLKEPNFFLVESPYFVFFTLVGMHHLIPRSSSQGIGIFRGSYSVLLNIIPHKSVATGVHDIDNGRVHQKKIQKITLYDSPIFPIMTSPNSQACLNRIHHLKKFNNPALLAPRDSLKTSNANNWCDYSLFVKILTSITEFLIL